jgi:pimeloyl-ACP methyl ester carboxylesterase
MRMQRIPLSGGSVAYLKQGQGPPLVLLHGWAGSSRYWHETLHYLSDSRTVYALDLPGYGESPPWMQPMGIQETAALVIEFADALGLECFDLNGHSFSTSVAVFVAITVPTRIRRLVLTCASTYRNEFERYIVTQIHRLLGLWIRLRRPWMGERRMIYRAATQRFFYREPADHVLRESFHDFLRMDLRTALLHAADVTSIDYHGALRRVPVPTLVISARQDMIMRTSGAPFLAQLIPNCNLQWIERCGHLPMIERPEVYHPLLRDFLLGEP